MKYSTIASIFVFLFLNACNPDFNTDKKDMGYKSSKRRLKSNKNRLNPKTAATQNQEAKPNQEIAQNQEEDPNKKTKSTLIDDLKNLLEKANTDRKNYEKKLEEEPSDQYGMKELFKMSIWADSQYGTKKPPTMPIRPDSQYESFADNTERSKQERKAFYCALNDIDISKLKELSEIIILSKKYEFIFNSILEFGHIPDEMILALYPKKDTLHELEISKLEKLKNLFEKFLSIKTNISEMINQLLLNYQNDINSIKTDSTKIESYIKTLDNQIWEKIKEAREVRNEILSLFRKDI
ncbi:virulence associated lipoprotein (plasmid) [Borreliella yangtzensis]|uniref:Virulent strain associated lipoprotein n=2 Tax=Borreliella TaxID=64895 RepID=A0ABR6PAP1_9SPIR|nr:virulence associated lipoprotein [Borreliella yangtzensis]MBB6043306.1 hypothetical protein [Borreliella yangtzensis]MBB6043337.1 hypothetical protein [Borreliella yangtzensis]WKC73848.1 virulence associated lipoprotein [Borreliella yangtzensis]